MSDLESDVVRRAGSNPVRRTTQNPTHLSMKCPSSRVGAKYKPRVYGLAECPPWYTQKLESPRTVVAADVKRMFDSASGKVRLWTALVQYHQPLQMAYLFER